MKSFRRPLALLSLLALGLSGTALASCGGSTTNIGVCLTTTSTTLNAAIGDAITEAFPDKTVSVQSADSDVTTQINQINAFITMGVEMIVVTPTEMTAIAETLQKARNSGIKVVISGANTDIECYDAITVSNEFLVGEYIALLASRWAEETYGEGGQYADQDFGVIVCYFEDNDDAKNRSAGLRMIKEPKLKDINGNYLDADGNIVSSAEQAADNPAYLSLIGTGQATVYEELQGLNITSGLDYMNALMTAHTDAKLFLCYMSGFASGMSQKIVDSVRYEDEAYGIFAGGVSGSEPAYLLGSLSGGVSQTFTHSGDEYTGAESIFRGAVSFGGADAAASLATLCTKVYYGTEGVDYQKKTTEAVGVWYTVEEENYEALAVYTPTAEIIQDIDWIGALSSSDTTIKWQSGTLPSGRKVNATKALDNVHYIEQPQRKKGEREDALYDTVI